MVQYFWNNQISYCQLLTIQAALVICGFVIRGFDYPRLSNIIRGFLKFLAPRGHKTTKAEVLVIRGFGIRAICAGHNPRE
jgi:hypothetical protein